MDPSDEDLSSNIDDLMPNQKVASQCEISYTAMSINEAPKLILKQEGKKLPQYVATLSVCLGSLAAGAVLGWTGNISEDMKSESYRGISIDDDSLGWIGSMATLGAAFGCIPIGKLCDQLGRKKAMLYLTIPFMIGWILIIFPQSLTMIYVGRFLTGMAGCAFCVSTPIYTCEIAEKSIRGALGSFFDLSLTVGILLAYIVPIFASMLVHTICMSILPIFFVIVFIFQPESPTYTIKINKEKKARTDLIRLRGSKYDIEPEIEIIKKECLVDDCSKISFVETIKKKGTQKAFIICFSIMFFQQAGGINAVIFYSGTIFETCGSTLDPKLATLVLGVMQMIATFIASAFVDKIGRRVLLICSNAIVTLSGLVLGFYFTLKERSLVSTDTISALGFLPVISLSVFVTLFSLGMGPIPWLLSTELFPSEVKSLGTGLAATINWLTAFFVTKFYLDLENAIGGDNTFYMFSVISLFGTLFIYFYLPETKGKALLEIQAELNR
ncbi:hypothetical protein RN001_009567 [Aquatica leii]|uniref:Major facilitator superfamily (MFS) profile domain-containing protein n=1 Tax=Aquatica leii TaxID=1421715 RepID=A0AAN7P819_9COLE|nr:hypothetical protein RN001_009567 [Aquatica leii]